MAAPADARAKKFRPMKRCCRRFWDSPSGSMLYEISAAVLGGNAQRCVELVAEVVNRGRDVNRLSRDLVEHFRNLLVARLTAATAVRRRSRQQTDCRCSTCPTRKLPILTAQSRALSIETLLDYFDFMAAGDEEISPLSRRRDLRSRVVLIRLAGLPQTLPVAELIERLERLEGKPSAAAYGKRARCAAGAGASGAAAPSRQRRRPRRRLQPPRARYRLVARLCRRCRQRKKIPSRRILIALSRWSYRLGRLRIGVVGAAASGLLARRR